MKTKVIFICIHNSARSQMAEGLHGMVKGVLAPMMHDTEH
jgi:protein-tyrosine-phosphatase